MDDISILSRSQVSKNYDIKKIIRKAIFFLSASVLFFSCCLIAFSLSKDGDRALQSLNKIRTWPIMAIISLCLLNYSLRAWRYRYYAECLSLSTSYREMLIYYIAGFAMSISPGKLGEMARLWLLKRRYGFSYQRGLSLQVADRANDLLAVLILCLLGMIGFEQYRIIVLTMILCVLFGIIILIWPGQLLKIIRFIYSRVRIQPRLFVRLKHIVQNISFVFSPKILLYSLILGSLGWLCECFALYLILVTLGSPISVLSAIFIFSFSSIAGGLTMLPGGLGGVELSMFTLLALNKVSIENATAATVVIRLCTLWFGVTIGFISLPIAIKMSNPRRHGR